MFLRLDRKEGRTNIFNLDNIASIYIDGDEVGIEFSPEEYFCFYKDQQPEEYERLKEYFLTMSDTDTINLPTVRSKT